MPALLRAVATIFPFSFHETFSLGARVLAGFDPQGPILKTVVAGAEHFGRMAQECVRWLPGCIGPGLVADPGSVTTDKIIGVVA